MKYLGIVCLTKGIFVCIFEALSILRVIRFSSFGVDSDGALIIDFSSINVYYCVSGRCGQTNSGLIYNTCRAVFLYNWML